MPKPIGLRPLTDEERGMLEKLAKSQTTPPDRLNWLKQSSLHAGLVAVTIA